MASQAADTNARVGSLVKSVGQPGAGNPHARLEEGAPVTLRTAATDRALLYNALTDALVWARRVEVTERVLYRTCRR